MSLEVFPQFVEVLPNDEHTFTARARTSLAMWHLISQHLGFVQPDFSVRQSQPGSAFVTSPAGSLGLASGVGTIEWTLDGHSVPSSSTTTFTITVTMTKAAGAWAYIVEVDEDGVRVLDEGSNVLADLAIEPVVGMRFKIEIASGFRLFIDDILQNARTSFASGILYPGNYRASISGAGATPSVLTAPVQIPAFRLSGDWQLQPLDHLGGAIVQFEVEHGTLNSGADALEKIYSGGSVPGQYKLSARIDAGVGVWVEDAAPSGSTVATTGGSWVWGTGSPNAFSGTARLKSPNAAGDHEYRFHSSPITMAVNQDDVLTCYVFLDATNTPTSIMLQWEATDSTGLAHRAYWGANNFVHGVNGTPSRRLIGALPATNQWVRLEVPASLVDMEGRVANGLVFSVYDGICSFDQVGQFFGKVENAESIIVIPPLQILGATRLTLQPSQKVRFQTNYDVAQTSLITWSVVSGSGSFSSGEFTAGAAPGTTVVRATASVGNQAADLTVNVPAVITPSFAFASPLEQIDFGTNITSPTWSSVPSGINSSTGVITFPNSIGQIVKITATDGTFTATRDVLIMDKFPITRTATPVEGERRKKVLISEAEDGTEVTRVKNKDGKAREYYSVQIKLLTLTDFNTIKDFWETFHPAKPFIWEDVPQGIRGIFKFDSDMVWRETGSGRFEVAFRVKSVVV